MDLENEREHMILWKIINRTLKELYEKAELNKKDSTNNQQTDCKATRGGMSSRTGQEPEGTCTHPQGKSKETFHIAREGLTQAVEATKIVYANLITVAETKIKITPIVGYK